MWNARWETEFSLAHIDTQTICCFLLRSENGWRRLKFRYENIRLVEQPPYSPELNPIEHLWEDLREKHFWNETFDSMSAVESAMVIALRTLEEDRESVQSMIQFPWIMHALAPY